MSKLLYFVQAQKHPYWKNIKDKQWSDWQWQIKNRVTDPKNLQKILKLSDKETADISHSLKILRMAITPYFLSQIDPKDPFDPIKLQAIPTIAETKISPSDFIDPLYEEEDCPVKGLEGILTHRYPDRLIFYVTYQCSMYCRHCTRRRHAGETDLPTPWKKILQVADYIKKTKTIRDVLISGGDPFTLLDNQLEKIIKLIRNIPHVEVIRIGTRTPVVCPMRITDKLCQMLKKYQPLWINTQFNHPKEMTDLVAKACVKLVDSGIPLGNQSVLLRRINNHPLVMRKLLHLLVANRIRPYYIFQCDLSQGIEHFRTKISEGIEIMENLRGHTSGFAIPTLVVDGPGGGGKVPVSPNYVLSQSHHKWVFRNYEGVIFNYTEPADYISDLPSNLEKYVERTSEQDRTGVNELLNPSSKKFNLIPQSLSRFKRRQHK